jgi:hypothetical protein
VNDFSISGDIGRPWLEVVRVAAAAFRQGDLVERPPFFYAANSEYPVWGLTKSAADAGDDRELLELHEDDRPEYGIITTQSCDLTEEGVDRPKKPWLQVAPLVDAHVLGSNLVHDVQRGRVRYLYLVPAPGLGDWVADLRIEVPLEKSWLVGRVPIAGFASLEEYQQFTRRLGHLRARAAIESGVCIDLVNDLRARLASRAIDVLAVLNGVSRVMLRVIGERAAPSAIQLVVASPTDPPDPAVEAFFEQWHDDFGRAVFGRGIALLPVVYQEKFSPDEYERLVVLDLDDLSPEGL